MSARSWWIRLMWTLRYVRDRWDMSRCRRYRLIYFNYVWLKWHSFFHRWTKIVSLLPVVPIYSLFRFICLVNLRYLTCFIVIFHYICQSQNWPLYLTKLTRLSGSDPNLIIWEFISSRGTEPRAEPHLQRTFTFNAGLYTCWAWRHLLIAWLRQWGNAIHGRDTYTEHDGLFQSVIALGLNCRPTSTSSTVDFSLISTTGAIHSPSNCDATVSLLRRFFYFHGQFGAIDEWSRCIHEKGKSPRS